MKDRPQSASDKANRRIVLTAAPATDGRQKKTVADNRSLLVSGKGILKNSTYHESNDKDIPLPSGAAVVGSGSERAVEAGLVKAAIAAGQKHQLKSEEDNKFALRRSFQTKENSPTLHNLK